MNINEGNPREEFRNRNLAEWKIFLLELFENNLPQSKTWTNIEDIISILNRIGANDSLTHLFFPHGGGFDLTGAEYSNEVNCIELHFGEIVYIVKPDYLAFESFGEEYEWAYFRLETLELKPSGVYYETSFGHEEITELDPGNYLDRSIWDQGFIGYDESGYEIPLTSTARVVIRSFGGSFVIFAKSSIYNRTPETYDARHNKFSPMEFRNQIEKVIEYLKNH